MKQPNYFKAALLLLVLFPWEVSSFQHYGAIPICHKIFLSSTGISKTKETSSAPSTADTRSSSFAPSSGRMMTSKGAALRGVLLQLSAQSDDNNNESEGRDLGSVTRIYIEYCIGCRWMLKSFWMAQELLTTFEDEIDAITIIPSSSTNGVYNIQLSQTTFDPETNTRKEIWNRKEKGGFPSPKELKQTIRDQIASNKFLGHSDTEERQEEEAEGGGTESTAATSSSSNDESVEAEGPWPWETTPAPAVSITYCTGCKWLLRAAYYGQELLTTFGGSEGEIKSVTLLPSKPPMKGGQFVSTRII